MASALAAGALVASGICSPAFADPAGAGSAGSAAPGSAAVVTPLLQMFVFGDTVGLPLGCSVAASALSNASTALAPALAQTVETCGTISADGYTMLEQGITESSSLTTLNFLLNPLLASGASQLQSIGTNDSALLGVLAPTVSSSGGTVAYFEGS